MTIRAFQGCAGCGKTYRLMQTLVDGLQQRPLHPGQRILALTYMHGSRRRLDGRLRDLKLAFECSTIDSFAWRVASRWRALAEHLNVPLPAETDYEAVCAVAGTLLEQPVVVDWVGATHPVVVIDEAQDFCAVRLRIVQALAARLTLLAAADEFQCLDEALRPNPYCSWIAETTEVETLEIPHRTNVPALLTAAAALRAGAVPQSAPPFEIRLAPSPALAGASLSNRIGWYRRGGTVAILTPTAGRYAKGAVEWATLHQTGRNQGPHRIRWEQAEKEVVEELLGRLTLTERCSLMEANEEIGKLGVRSIVTAMREWLAIQQRAVGRQEVDPSEIENLLRRVVSHGRRFARGEAGGLLAMTVHGAKNREFDGVVVLWPHEMGGDDEAKRRLLYNAVTRAKRWCLVLVEGERLLRKPPFAD